eukprot:955723-Prymnesium_polylepis.1
MPTALLVRAAHVEAEHRRDIRGVEGLPSGVHLSREACIHAVGAGDGRGAMAAPGCKVGVVEPVARVVSSTCDRGRRRHVVPLAD